MDVLNLEVGDRLVISRLPDGFVWHVETQDSRIWTQDLHARGFEEIVAEIRVYLERAQAGSGVMLDPPALPGGEQASG